MYTISALWTHARENLDITTVIYNNSAYAILRMELQRVGAESAGEGGVPGPKAARLLDLSDPELDFVALATGMGVPAVRATTAEELIEGLRRAFDTPGPQLIDAVIPPLL
jgi:acetolactate synthase-1/2/3 large subunit